MPRLSAVNPSTDTGPGADFLNGPLKNKQINLFKGIAVNANVLEGLIGFIGKSQSSGALSKAEHEIVALVAAQQRGCDYCLAAHTKLAEGEGLNEDAVLGIRQRNADSDKHQALVDFTQAILDTNGYVTDEQLQAFKAAGYDDAAVISVIAELAISTFTNYYNHVAGTEIDFPVAAAV